MPDNSHYVTLDPDSRHKINMISFNTHKSKNLVLKELITEGMRIRDMRESSLDRLREKRSEDYEGEMEKLIAFLPKLLCVKDDGIDENEFFNDEISYLIVALTIYLLDSVIPSLLSEVEI
jgi:hypothetical protein